jgi:Tfp pilus assembly PilM family ATPase/Tfp pilus assembly protein PilN
MRLTKDGSILRGESVVVVEPGAEWFKAARFTAVRGGLVLQDLRLRQIDMAAGDVSQRIADTLDGMNLEGQSVIASIPRQLVTARMWELPSTDRHEIADMIDLQVGKMTPYSPEEIIADYRLLQGSRPGYTRIMLAIVQRSVVRQRYYLLEDAGVEVGGMTISSEGLLNWLEATLCRERQDGVFLVADLDASYAEVGVVARGSLVFTRSILVGGDSLLGEYEKAQKKLAREIQGTLDIFKGEHPDLSVSRVFVSGAGSRMPDLVSYLGGELGLPVEARSCLAGLKGKPQAPDVESGPYRALSLTALVGIAQRPGALAFNLVPDPVKMRRSLTGKARSLTGVGVLVAGALVSGSLLAHVNIYLKKARIETVRRLLRETEPAVARVERMQAVASAVRERTDSSLAPLNLLSELHVRVPRDVYFDAIDMDWASGQVRLVGTAGNPDLVIELEKNLRGAEAFSDVKASGSTTQDPRTKRFRFEITAFMERDS